MIPMEDKIEVKTGEIDNPKVLELSNITRGSWGDMDFLKWIYYDIPTADEEENIFAITEDEKVVGFRRCGRKNIIILKEFLAVPVIDYKHTSVHPEYQGQGIFTKLIQIGKPFTCNSIEFNFEIALVRKSNIPFKRHSSKGWRHRVLPLYICILSPKNVIGDYARFLNEKNNTIGNLARKFGKKLYMVFSDGKINVSEMFNGKPSKGLGLNIYVSDTAVKKIVENLTGELSPKELLKDAVGLFLKGDINLFEIRDSNKTSIPKNKELKVEIKNKLGNKELNELLQLYSQCLKDYELTFERGKKDIEHILSYPKNTDIILVRKNGKLVGFSVLGLTKEENKKEVWVMDIIHKDESVFHKLIHEIERICRVKKMDSIHLFSDIDPGHRWTHIPETTLMWDSLEKIENIEHKFKNARWKISHYDVL